MHFCDGKNQICDGKNNFLFTHQKIYQSITNIIHIPFDSLSKAKTNEVRVRKKAIAFISMFLL